MSDLAGSWQACLLAYLVVFAWLISGIWIGFSDSLYQLVANTVTTLVTYVLLFHLHASQNNLQTSQNRETAAIQVRLYELIRANKDAKNTVLAIEEGTQEEIIKAKEEIKQTATPEESKKTRRKTIRKISIK